MSDYLLFSGGMCCAGEFARIKEKKVRLFLQNPLDLSKTLCYNNRVERRNASFGRTNLGVAQLVARYLGVVEAASSSLVTQTISSVHNRFQLWTLDIFYVCIYILLFGVAFCYSFPFRLRLVGIRSPRLDGSRG